MARFTVSEHGFAGWAILDNHGPFLIVDGALNSAVFHAVVNGHGSKPDPATLYNRDGEARALALAALLNAAADAGALPTALEKLREPQSMESIVVADRGAARDALHAEFGVLTVEVA